MLWCFCTAESDDEFKSPMEDNELRFLTTNKGKQVLVHHGHVYRINRHRGRLRYWECVKRRTKLQCHTKLTTEYNRHKKHRLV
uniref:FLYWCH-type domain-containing protein n=1 Tax=Anopheles stephensi TaxID=30069 RepID=A0A182Y4G7_ANOST